MFINKITSLHIRKLCRRSRSRGEEAITSPCTGTGRSTPEYAYSHCKTGSAETVPVWLHLLHYNIVFSFQMFLNSKRTTYSS